MNHTHKILNMAFSFMLCFVMVVSAVQPGAAQKAAGPAPAPQAQSGVRYGYNANTGKLSFVGTDPNAPIAVADALALPAGSAVGGLALIAPYAQEFGLKDPSQELNLEKAQSDGKLSTTRYQQTYQGIPIMAGELIVNADNQNRLVSLSGDISPDPSLSTTPAVSAGTARQNALAAVAKWYGQKPEAFTASEPALWIYDARLLEPDGLPTALTWRLDVRATDISQPVDELVLVDAQTGGIRLHFNQLDTSWSQARTSDDPQSTDTPTDGSTDVPTATPTNVPTPTGTLEPTNTPTEVPTGTPVPTDTPVPTETPVSTETSVPTETLEPTDTLLPSQTPGGPTAQPTGVSPMSGNTWYVAPDGNDNNTCKTPDQPCANINSVTQNLASTGDLIMIAAGTYTDSYTPPVVSIDKNLTLSGGWDTTFQSQAGFSVIDSQNADRQGIYINKGIITTIERLIVENGNLGGIYIDIDGDLTLNQSAVINNHGGHGINNNGTLTLNESTVSGNDNSTGGGGIENKPSSKLTLNNSTISGNSAPSGYGGGIDNSGTTTLNNTTVADNSAGQGGGINENSGSVTMANSILAGNTLTNSSPQDCSGHIISAGYNLIGNTTGCTFSATATDKTNLDARLGSLVGLPGYHIPLYQSPAIDAGNPAAPGSGGAACLATDQVGTTRPIDGNNDGIAVCDIGSFETELPVASSMSINAGSPQSSGLSTDYYTRFSVIVNDQYDNPLPNATVTFTAPTTGPGGSFNDSGKNSTTAITDINGIATAAVFHANHSAGSFVVQASTAGIASPVQFQLENYVPVVTAISVSSGSPQDAEVDTAISSPLKALVTDQRGIRMPGVTVTFTAPATGPSGTFAGSGTRIGTAVTDADGTATAPTFSANDTIGSYTIHATVAGLSTSADFQIFNRGRWYVAPTGSDSNNCYTVSTPCLTIAAAIGQAIDNETIFVASGTYTGSGTQVLSIDESLSILGGWDASFTNQAGVSVIDGQSARQGVSVAASKSVTLQRFTIQNGYATSSGGGLYNAGSLTLKNVLVQGNTVFNGSGGGVFNDLGASLDLIQSAIVNNRSTSTSPSADSGRAGGLYNRGTASLINSTIGENQADENGGGIYNIGSIDFNSVTIAHNYAAGLAGGIYEEGGDNANSSMQNTLLAYNGASQYPDCGGGTIISDGYNLISDSADCVFVPVTGDLINEDPKLDLLVNTPGVPAYYPLQVGSPAIDAGNPAVPGSAGACPATDQRGVARPVGAACDIGAYEGSIASGSELQFITYDAKNGTDLRAALVCDQDQPGCSGGADPQADAAQAYALDTYHFYTDHYGPDSFDMEGKVIISTVHYDQNYDNAFWDGAQVVYGDAHGYPMAEDVVAHELTHGITQSTSGLYFYYQSGAINESFSDLWGEFVDQTNYKGTDAAAVKWLIGEDISGLGAIRDMKNPPHFKQPDKMTSSYYFKGWQDNGGVHTNSGINNKAVYLMTDGGSFNGKTVSGIGLNKVAAIYFEAQTHLLTSGSDYSDLYYALYQGCLNLVGGKEGISLADCLQVRNATDAVQMNQPPSSNYNPQADLCPSGQSTGPALSLFKDDMENGMGKWQTNQSTNWFISSGFATSGTHMLWGVDQEVSNDSFVWLASDITIPWGSSPFLYFNHAYDFEYGGYYTPSTSLYYDGGVLEYSVDDGGWKDAKALYSAGANYGGTLAKNNLNPLEGRAAFVGSSHGYVSSRYNLASLAGHRVNFRWRIGTDYANYSNGWYLDDVQVYTCQGTPAIPAVVAPANNALVTSYTPLLSWKDASSPYTYQLQLATDSLFTQLVTDRNDLTGGNFTPLTALIPNTTYYWHVRAFNPTGGSLGWSKLSSFRTVILPANLTAPGDGEALPTNRPTFAWDAVTGASSYTIQISKINTFASLVTTGNASLPIFVPTSNLPTGMPLYWRVQAKGSNGPSAWSSPRTLSLSGLPPSVPALAAPAANALTTTYTPAVSWGKVTLQTGTTFGHYELQISTSPVFASLALDKSDSLTDINVGAYTLAAGEALNPNTTYYWRVCATNSVGDYSGWSLTRTLRTALLPPTLSTPADGTNLLNNRPAFDWQAVSAATGYTVQISRNAGFTSLVGKYNVGPSIYTPKTDLPANIPLFWRVQSTGANGPSAWSDVRTLTTANPPGTPTLVAPADKALTTNYTPLLDWSDVKVPVGAAAFDHYQVQVDDSVDFSSPVIDDGTIILITHSNYTPVTPLPPNTTYYWWVRSYNTLGQYSAWSSVRSFRTALLPPTLSGPDDGTDLLNNRPAFGWTSVGGASKYAIQISRNTGFTSLVGTYTVTSSTYTPAADLPAASSLYWRVQSQGANGPSAWSGYRTIITANPPSIPVLASPSDNSLVNPLAATLAWKIINVPAGTQFSDYQLQLGRDANFNYIVSDWQLTDLNQTKYTFQLGMLDGGLTYYWRMRSVDVFGEYSSWSAVRKFRTTLLAPTLIEPVNGLNTSNPRPTFSWSSVTGATTYTMQVGTDPQFTKYLWFTLTTSSTSFTPSFDFPGGYSFYWRVRASGPNGVSPWSEIWYINMY